MARSYVIDVGSLPVRPVQRASVLLAAREPAAETSAVVLDVDGDEFVRLPPMGPGRPLSLSPDGRSLLCVGPDGLFVSTIATAEHVAFDTYGADGRVAAAALSPDGRSIAALTGPRATAESHQALEGAVGLVDVATGEYRRLGGRLRGHPTTASVVSWAPDGTRFAVAYGDPHLGVFTAVFTTTGRRIGLFGVTQPLACGNGNWIDDTRLLCARTGWKRDQQQLTILDVTTGARQVLATCDRLPFGRLDERLVGHDPFPADGFPSRGGNVRLPTTDMRGGDPRPFLTVKRPRDLVPIDVWATPYPPQAA